MKWRLKLLTLSAILLSTSVLSCEMVMGYRTSARLPFIAEHPSKQGLYFTLYQRALESIGCTLTVRRAPKKRILKLIAEGEIDFYPGLGSSPGREQYLHFIENGFISHIVAISHKDIADIHSFADMEGKVLLTAIGSNVFDTKGYEIHLRQAHDLSVTTAVKLLSEKRADFYFYNEVNIRYYLKLNPNDNIKIHPCCFPSSAMTLGFSKKSKYAQTIPNPASTSSKRSLSKNKQLQLAPSSKALAFKEALAKLKSDGVTAKLVDAYSKQ